MSNDLQKAPGYSQEVDLIETVRGSVFPNSTDSELKLFMFKCTEVGVHPLSGMIAPAVYVDHNTGARRTSFISTIDLFRSLSEDAGDYDGMDEIEFIGETSEEYDGKVFVHPDEAICRVYRKGIDRPFVGRVRWEEFYPGDKKGFMWRRMPRIMLGKCAEAQARRLAWPKKLNQLYSPEEMERGFEAMATTNSSKPAVTSSQVHVGAASNSFSGSSDQDSLRKPTDDERRAGKLINEKQAYLLSKECRGNGVDIEAVAKAARVDNIFWLTWQKTVKTNFNVMLNLVKEKPNSFAKFSSAAEVAHTANNVPTVMDSEEFSSLVESLAMQAGMSVAEGLKEVCGVDTAEDVLPELQSKVIDYFTAKAEGTAA